VRKRHATGRQVDLLRNVSQESQWRESLGKSTACDADASVHEQTRSRSSVQAEVRTAIRSRARESESESQHLVALLRSSKRSHAHQGGVDIHIVADCQSRYRTPHTHDSMQYHGPAWANFQETKPMPQLQRSLQSKSHYFKVNMREMHRCQEM
jgi:hypothetical protein